MKTKTITSRSFAKRALMVLAVLFTTLTAGATEFITDVMLIGNKNETEFKNLQDKLEKEGWTAIKKDLNAGAGGDYIYLLYKSEENGGSGGDAGTGVAASETLYGDVNVDGSVDNLDVTLINKYLLGTAELSEQGKKNADVDANGTIDTTDSLNILKCCLELIEQSKFPIK